jgi:hypothetical protein
MPPPVTEGCDGIAPVRSSTHRGFRAGRAQEQRLPLRLAPAAARNHRTSRTGIAARPTTTTPEPVLTPAGR